MKKQLLLTSIAALLFCQYNYAGNAELFKVDEQVISEKFRGLDQLETYVNQNEGVVLTDVQARESSLVKNFDAKGSLGMFSMNSEAPLGIPSFIWGCTLGWVGILIVYLISEDKKETMMALWGCIANGAIGIVIYIIYIAWVLSLSTM